MKNNYEVSEISLEDAESLIQKEHYLKDIYGKDHPYPQSIIHDCFGLFNQNKLVGAVQFCSYVPSPNPRYHEWVKDFFGCHTDTCEGFYEIARLAVEPQDEHNITSWFLSRAIKLLNPKVLVTSADAEFYDGTIYSATNFDYYGEMHNRDFYYPDKPHHVYLKIFDENIKCEWKRLDK